MMNPSRPHSTKPGASSEALGIGRTRCCPACGTAYLQKNDGPGCPVCLFRQAFNPAAVPPSGGAAFDEGRFDHYELGVRKDGAFDELGRGAMGITYRARDTILDRAVALKVLDARVASRPEARERFLREARAAARLRHPHVASVFYYGVRKADGQCFYAMELVEGETVEARVRRGGPLLTSEALEVTAQVARALGAAEAQGLVHRDLKPSNLMLVNGPELFVKVIDFGVAKAVAGAGETNLTYGGFVGTPAFASPEQFTGVDVDARADLYSLGATLWEMLTGRPPFRGSRVEVMRQHLQAPLPLARLHGLPEPVVVLLERLLEKDPALRFQSPAQLLQALPGITSAIQPDRSVRRQGLNGVLQTGPGSLTRKQPPSRRGPRRISIARLPVTGKEIFGREEDVSFLDAAWANPQVHIVTIVAWAGVGKSTLVNHWLRRMAAASYRSAELVFGWSFYRQGTCGEASSADEFLDAALNWFGDPDPRLGTAWEKGERLARLITRQPTLLILDGLEPLQNPPGPQEGRLREPALQALIRELAASNRGLCVITTRMAVTDLGGYESGSAPRRDLEHLSGEAGAQLLRALGLKGEEPELRRASEEFGGHCLALTLLGSYLTDAYHGDVRCRDEVSSRLTYDVRQGAHARTVMASYQGWFGEGPELSVLRLIGFFDRPADERVLAALLTPPVIPGVTESLTDLRPAEWRMILARLRRARLLAGEDPYHPGQLDAHPLVREYFGAQLQCQRADAWKEGNRRLYGYYRTLAPQQPETFRDMEPLFLAVACGCRAGFYRDALHEVYLPRIQRGDASFTAKVLGARGALVSVLANFFENGHWGSLAQGSAEGQTLTAEDQLFILMQAGLYLTATRGSAAPEAHCCYERAEALCQGLACPLPLYSALTGQWRFTLCTDKLTVAMQIAQRVHSIAQEQNDAALLIGAYRALACTLYRLGDFKAACRYASRGIELWRSGDAPSSVEEVSAPAVPCFYFEALCKWHLGETASCHASMMAAISLAKELNETFALAEALFFAAVLGYCVRDHARVERLAAELMELSTRQHFAFWLVGARILRGWARTVSDNPAEGIAWIEDGLRDYRATGTRLGLPSWLVIKAEALHLVDRTSEALEALREAEAVAESSEERSWCAELFRFRGVYLAAMGADEMEIQAAFSKAIQMAEEQGSISLLKRAEMSYADYRIARAGKPSRQCREAEHGEKPGRRRGVKG
ncbi:MAG: protein kinase [Verrucomicrobia bacterium]|nr:protein kinase [Verrucomicrobiota bacterium]